MRIGPSLVDITTGYTTAIGILAALLHRDRISGEGQHIDIALLDTAVAMQSHMVQGYLVDGIVPERKGTVGNGGHPSKVFRCRDGTIYISYDRNRATDGEILLARFTEEDILAKKPVGPKSKLKMLISKPGAVKKKK